MEKIVNCELIYMVPTFDFLPHTLKNQKLGLVHWHILPGRAACLQASDYYVLTQLGFTLVYPNPSSVALSLKSTFQEMNYYVIASFQIHR